MKIRLTLDAHALQSGPVLKAARTAFGDGFVDKYKFRSQSIDVDCTAEQLARFLVLRDDLGAQNLWKALNVRIMEDCPVPPSVLVDVRPINGRCG